MTDTELNKLKQSIVNGIAEGFNKMPKYIIDSDGNSININDLSDKRNPINESERSEYLNRLNYYNKKDKIDELQRQIETLRSGKYSKRGAAKQKIRELTNEQERIGNGVSKEDVKKYRANMLQQVVQQIAGLSNSIVDIIVAHNRYALALSKNEFEFQQNIEKAKFDYLQKQIKSVTTTFNGLTTGIATDAAFSVYSTSGTEAIGKYEKQTKQYTAVRQFEANQIQRDIDMINNTTAALGTAIASIGGIVAMTGIGAGVGGIIASIGGLVAGVGRIVSSFKKIDYEQIKQITDQFQQQAQLVQEEIGGIKEIVDSFDSTVKTLGTHIQKNDSFYKSVGLMFGYSGDKYSAYSRRIAADVSRRFGINAQQQQQMLSGYINESSRSRIMNAREFENIYATGKVFGISESESAQIYGGMNIFNTSIEDGAKMFGNMYHTITKMGLSTAKFGKELNNNLKLAQKYNFKGGLENMMKMTKWAQQTRFNLNSATSFADKLVNGSLSEVLETSAKLQVLGGAAAMYSDPLGMMYDAGANVGDTAKRMAAMFSDITGTFNRETGETEFSWYENRMIGARAQALGMDEGEVRNMIRQNQKQGVIDETLGKYKLDEETRTAIGNRAVWDKKSQTWRVNTIGDKTMTIEDVAKLTDEQRAKVLLPNNEKEGIIEIAENTRSIEELLRNNLETKQNEKQVELFGSVKELVQTTIKAQNILFDDDGFVQKAKESIKSIGDLAIIQAEGTVNFFTENTELISQYRSMVETEVENSKKRTDLMAASIEVITDSGIEGLRDIQIRAANANNEPNTRKRKAAMAALYSDATPIERKYLRAAYPQYAKDNTFRTPLPIPSTESDNYGGTFGSSISINHHDGRGNTNGGIISGASNVQPINDGGINVKTARKDQYLAAMPNGPIDKILQQLIPGLQALLSGNGSSSNDVNINVNGRLDLSQSGFTVNIVDIIKNDPSKLTEFVAMLERTTQINVSGKPSRNYMV